jgi:hypothetical protein
LSAKDSPARKTANVAFLIALFSIVVPYVDGMST